MSAKKLKNTISDSSINVGNNLHIGDIINVHLERAIPLEKPLLTAENIESIKLLIGKGELEKAINLLLGYAKGLDQLIFNEIISIARQWEALQRDTRIGLLSTDEKFRLASKVTYSLLESADALQRTAS